jgi:hypothetical protein
VVTERRARGPAGAGNTYAFENIVVNLAGTMGTRYLKASFLVTGADPTLRGQFEANKPRMLDVTLNVLSSLTLSDLEEAGRQEHHPGETRRGLQSGSRSQSGGADLLFRLRGAVTLRHRNGRRQFQHEFRGSRSK